ncbi:DUF4153 domain-containing protein [Clostridium sp.]|uniref:DUF4153 domain-containing protein n=1 Tax=Clostridium sp. TaxID=1506 RepID=UPI002FCBA049
MKIIHLFKDMAENIKNSLQRFPITILLSTACVILLIYMRELGFDVDDNFREKINKITMILALGIPFSLVIKLCFERLSQYSISKLYASYLGGAIVLVLYYYFLLKDFNMVSITRYTGFTLAFYLIFLFIAYLPNRDNFELYIVRIFTRFFTTIIYSVVLFLGVAAILFTLHELLGFNIESNMYYYSWLIVVGVFAPTFFLAGVPYNTEKLILQDFPKLLKVLILYIVMPLLTIYTVILYIYFGKIIITTQWPQGLVSHLVLWYSVIMTMVLFFISPLRKENSWANKFMNTLPKLILPLIFMMFISIGIRINAYGVTENRYYVVALGIWVLLVMLYFSFAKKIRNIVLLISLVIVILISVFSPISSYSISRYSQNKRFVSILQKNNMIDDNKIIKASGGVSDEDKNEVSSIIRYFNSNHSLENLKLLPQDFKIEQMEQVLGFKYSDGYDYNNDGFFYFNVLRNFNAIDISGYDYLLDSRNGSNNSSNNNPISMHFDYESGMVKIEEGEKEVYSKDFTDFANLVIEKYGVNQNHEDVLLEDMCFIDENNEIKVKIQFLNMAGRKNSSTGKIESKGFEFYILVKLK